MRSGIGTQMIVWGGRNGDGYLKTGGRYSPANSSWQPTSLTYSPIARMGHTAIWTGTQMIVWGGWAWSYSNTGGRYDPATDQWKYVSTTGAPSQRYAHTAVWTSNHMIVWGGTDSESYLMTGGRYWP
jgi:N-acetylneuraminic acid mutarotase